MKLSSFVTMILGTVSGMLFSLGMCMTRVSEFGSFKVGVIFGVIGLVLGIITFFVWRKMENKAPIKFNLKKILFAVFGVVGALVLGVGMCFCLVWDNLVLGVAIGCAGIVMLISLIPIVKGIHK